MPRSSAFVNSKVLAVEMMALHVPDIWSWAYAVSGYRFAQEVEEG